MSDRERAFVLPEPDRAELVAVNRTQLRVWQWGDGSAPPVLFLHGAYDHGRMFDDLAPRVAALGYHAIALDFRGHGDSDTQLVALARIGSRPSHTSSGNVISEPPPATELIAPAMVDAASRINGSVPVIDWVAMPVRG